MSFKVSSFDSCIKGFLLSVIVYNTINDDKIFAAPKVMVITKTDKIEKLMKHVEDAHSEIPYWLAPKIMRYSASRACFELENNCRISFIDVITEMPSWPKSLTPSIVLLDDEVAESFDKSKNYIKHSINPGSIVRFTA